MSAEIIYGPATRDRLLSPLRTVYLLYGEDDRQKDETIEFLRDRCVDPSFTDFDFEAVDVSTHTPTAILAAANMAPFGSERRLVVVRGAELLRRRERVSDAEQLAEGIAQLGSASCLVLRASAGEDEAKRGKTVITSRLDAAVRARGFLVKCRSLGVEDLQELAIAKTRAEGKILHPDAAERLVQAAGGDRDTLDNELEKAICYVGERPHIGLTDVDAVCSYDAEDVMFKLVDAVGQRNADRALALLEETLRYDTKPQSVAGRLLSLLTRQFRLLWQARELMARRIEAGAIRQLPAEVASELPAEGSIAGMAWKAGDLFRQARGWDRASLVYAFEQLVATDLANKGGEEGSEDVVTNLKLLVVRLCSKG